MMDQRQSVMEVMNGLTGVSLRERNCKQLKYYIHLTEEMAKTAIEALDLSQRSYNCLMRAGYNTIGDICRAVADGKLKSVPCYFKIPLIMLDSCSFTYAPSTSVFY